jgi:cyclopropane fatty-acyl-phospholipid synthase-like methyltransferase
MRNLSRMPTIAVDARAYEEAVSVVVSVEWLSDSDHDKHLAFIAAMDRLLQQGERMLLRLNFVVFRDTLPDSITVYAFLRSQALALAASTQVLRKVSG